MPNCFSYMYVQQAYTLPLDETTNTVMGLDIRECTCVHNVAYNTCSDIMAMIMIYCGTVLQAAFKQFHVQCQVRLDEKITLRPSRSIPNSLYGADRFSIGDQWIKYLIRTRVR